MTETLKTAELDIDWKTHDEVSQIHDYVEEWRIILWDNAYHFVFRFRGGYTCLLPFAGEAGNDNAMKRLAYW